SGVRLLNLSSCGQRAQLTYTSIATVYRRFAIRRRLECGVARFTGAQVAQALVSADGFTSQSRPLGCAAVEHTRLPLCVEEGASVAIPLIPVKTPDGHAELSQRQRRLSQRHRTVLLLVDGRRTEGEVRQLARQAGATDSCFGELIELGLIL